MSVKESCTELPLDDRSLILGVARELAFCYHFWALVTTPTFCPVGTRNDFPWSWSGGSMNVTTHVLPKSGIWVYFRVCPFRAFVGKWISQVELCTCYSESYWINSPTLFIKQVSDLNRRSLRYKNKGVLLLTIYASRLPRSLVCRICVVYIPVMVHCNALCYDIFVVHKYILFLRWNFIIYAFHNFAPHYLALTIHWNKSIPQKPRRV
jgi:hypothetical protein